MVPALRYIEILLRSIDNRNFRRAQFEYYGLGTPKVHYSRTDTSASSCESQDDMSEAMVATVVWTGFCGESEVDRSIDQLPLPLSLSVSMHLG